MDILVVGANGQLGNELRSILESGVAEIGPIPNDYRGACCTFVDIDVLDISSKDAVTDYFANHSYDLVINCAAYTNVDGCEQNEALAYSANAAGPGNLAEACERSASKFVHVSTDYVFPGTESRPRREDDQTDPLSAYGRTKLAGEEKVLEACHKAFIVRTAWLYGYVGKNFVKTMLALGESRDSVTVVDDQYGNPTSANDLAYEILKIALTDNYGIYHCTNEGICSWADFAEAIMNEAGLNCVVKRCSSEEYKQLNPASASRPAFSALENAHLATTVGNEMRPWQDAIHSYIEKLAKQ